MALRGGYNEDRERKALRLIAGSFFVLATYVVVEAFRDLFFVDSEPSPSAVGIVLAALSLAVMPALAIAKRRTAIELGSPTLRADAAETMLCAWLSVVLEGSPGIIHPRLHRCHRHGGDRRAAPQQQAGKRWQGRVIWP